MSDQLSPSPVTGKQASRLVLTDHLNEIESIVETIKDLGTDLGVKFDAIVCTDHVPLLVSEEAGCASVAVELAVERIERVVCNVRRAIKAANDND